MKKLLLFFFLQAVMLSLRAQDIRVADRTEIQQRALRQMRQFEGLLNLLAKPSEYFKTYSLEELTEKYYSDSSSYQLFLDSTVIIESDILPSSHAANHQNLSVQEYLITFFDDYEKSPATSVFFSNYEVSPVRRGDIPSVDVYYDVRLDSHHRDYPQLDYPTHRRKATLVARRRSDNWQLIITDVGYVPDTGSLPPAVATTGTATKVDKIDSLFTALKSAYKIGKTYALPMRTDEVDTTAKLVLYRKSEPVEDLSNALASPNFSWRVPKVSDGAGYRLRFQDTQTGQIVESSSFEIKRKFPWWFVGVGVGAAGILYLISSGGDDNGAGELPAPPSPN